MSKKKETLTIVVNGTATEVEVNENAPLRTAIPKALHQTHNAGQPVENWLLKDRSGTELELDRKIGQFGFDDATVLFLDLKAGIGG